MAKIEKKDAVRIYGGDDGQYVAVPMHNKLGKPHPGAAINEHQFKPGKTYYLAPEFAEELERILDVYEESTLRILLSNRDAVAMQHAHGRNGIVAD